MILQLTTLLVNPNITILDNGSTEPSTVSFLSQSTYPVIYAGFQGPDVWMTIYDQLPDIFVVTNCDILFQNNMPSSFLDDFLEISQSYGSTKTGNALYIWDYPLMYSYKFSDYGYPGVQEIWTSQLQYWSASIQDPTYELYQSPLDVTFFLYNKNNAGPDIRVASNYSTRILSWYLDIASIYSQNDISRLHLYFSHLDLNDYDPLRFFQGTYLQENDIVPVTKTIGDVSVTHLVRIEGNESSLFWQTTYESDYNPLFSLFSLYLSKDKDYIDIGSWIGDTFFYPSRFSKRVIGVEPDPDALLVLNYLKRLTFLDTPLIIEESALYSSMTSSTMYLMKGSDVYQNNISRIDLKGPQPGDVQITTLTFGDLLDKYSITSISLINVNINGGEEHILQDVYDYSFSQNVPLYVTFYYSLWSNRNISRFTFLTESQKTSITSGVVSILFNTS